MKTEIFCTYPHKTELHCHTLPVSGCSKIYPEEMVQLYKALGVDTIVLTNHYHPEIVTRYTKEEAVERYLKAFYDLKECAEAEGMVAVFGMEIRFAENNNDYLAYGMAETDVASIFDYLPGDYVSFYKNFKSESNLFFQAHPFRDGMELADPQYLDGIEAFNMYPRANSRVSLARAYAQEKGMQIIGGSDCHVQGHEGCILMRTKQRIESSEDLVAALKSKDYIFEVFGSIILP